MISHWHWKDGAEYFDLIEKLWNGRIEFWELTEKEDNLQKKFKRFEFESIVFEPDWKSEGFDTMIDEIISVFDLSLLSVFQYARKRGIKGRTVQRKKENDINSYY